MFKSPVIAVMIVIALTAFSGAQTRTTETSDPLLEGCVVKIIEDKKISVREPGVLVHLAVDEGSLVRAGDQIGQVDDSEPQMQKKVAKYGFDAAVARARNTVEIEFQKLTAALAEVDHQMLLEANLMAAGAIAKSEVRRAKLDWDKSLLGIEKTVHDRELAKLEAYAKQAELEAAELAIERRKIYAPFDGEVVTIFRHQDEWANPGDPILRLVRVDTMDVEGRVNQSQYDPHEVHGCEVTVEVLMARGRKETVRGRIKHVSPLVQLNGEYVVRAEVPNRQEHGRWMLRDGHTATMTIHLDTGVLATAARQAQ